ncbi:MAG: hypothetical protein ACRYG8_49540, partial [Janthinobacterium lividum]
MNTTTSSINLPEVAWREGWTLSECGAHPDGSPIIQLQKLDSQQPELPSFAADRDAWDHVVARARTGSAPHRAVLDQVDRVERTWIEA